MIFYLFVTTVLMMSGAKLYSSGTYNSEYLSRDNTTAVRGIFTLLIIAAHLRQYITFDTVWDAPFISFIRFVDQNVVSMFLFYSGFGIGEAVKRKGRAYIRRMPASRILPTLINFDLAIAVYLLVQYLRGTVLPLNTIAKSLIGLVSVGNSNWYIFAILVCYTVTWFILTLLYDQRRTAAALISILILGYILVLAAEKPQEPWWYNTMLCYPLGLFFAEHREKIERYLFAEKSALPYGIALTAAVTAVLVLRPYRSRLVIYEIWALLFVLMIVLLSAKIQIASRPLLWIGKHTFEIYILQRIPMMLLKDLGSDSYPYLFVILTVTAVLAMAYGFGKITGKVSKVCRTIGG